MNLTLFDLDVGAGATRVCRRCGSVKPYAAFHSNGVGRNRLRICAACRNKTRDWTDRRVWTPEQRLKKKLWHEYRLTVEQYEAMTQAQGGKCAICRREVPPGKRLSVDHCHKTGVVRALLCTGCNLAVGFYENHGQAAAEYLATYGAGNPLLKQ